MGVLKPYTPEQSELAHKMLADGAPWVNIAKAVGDKTSHRIRCHLDPAYKVKRNEIAAAYGRKKNAISTGVRPRGGSRHPAVRPPTGALEERDRLFALPRTLAQELLGDPLPGRSALDRRAPL